MDKLLRAVYKTIFTAHTFKNVRITTENGVRYFEFDGYGFCTQKENAEGIWAWRASKGCKIVWVRRLKDASLVRMICNGVLYEKLKGEWVDSSKIERVTL